MKKIIYSFSIIRIVAALLMLKFPTESNVFWIIYAFCFISDLLDGYLSKDRDKEVKFAPTLDTLADYVFYLCITIKVIGLHSIPRWLIVWTLIILGLHFINYIIGFVKFKSFSNIQTYLNSLTGIIFMLFPLVVSKTGVHAYGVIFVTIGLFACLEEMSIILKSKRLNKYKKHLFDR
jgi:CDP-diacylglycerol--glycerol-3-phosphate 3-phosphatidyltransferase